MPNTWYCTQAAKAESPMRDKEKTTKSDSPSLTSSVMQGKDVLLLGAMQHGNWLGKYRMAATMLSIKLARRRRAGLVDVL